jgi:hypothetical protein
VGLFSKKPVICPICRAEVDTSNSRGIGHFGTHLDDADPSMTSLRLACGCTDAVFSSEDDFPRLVCDHLRDRHGLKI